MATKKKKTIKTMDVVAPKKKTQKKRSASMASLEIHNSPLRRPMSYRPEPEVSPKEEVQKEESVIEEEPMKNPIKNLPLKIVSTILVLGTAVSIGFLIFNISRSNLLPAKFFYPIVFALAIIMLLFLRFTIRKKTKIPAHIIIDLFSVIFLAASLFGNFKLNDTLTFLDKNLNGASYQTVVYDVITGEDSKYDSKDSLKDASIIAPPDFILSEDELINAVRDQLNANLTFNENNDGVTNLPLEDKDSLILLGDAIYTSMTEASSDYESKTKIVTTIKIEKRIDKDANNGDIAEKPFLLFLSGIDAREDYMPYASRSDVNMVIAVNPKTAQILLLTIPRDYQIHVPGTSGGLNDKMTHTGSLGGVQLSKATAEELLGIKFDDYVRVNFGFVVGLVDAISGITIDSDWDTPITCWTDRRCVIQPGKNDVDGECALAFARERKAYDTGDTHRAENQQQVIGKIFDKISGSTLINNYSSILDALDGTFETSLTSSDLQSFVRLQLDKNPHWKIHSYTLATNGHDELYTYSYPTEPLYVAYQDPASVAKGKQMIQEILNGN